MKRMAKNASMKALAGKKSVGSFIINACLTAVAIGAVFAFFGFAVVLGVLMVSLK